MDISVSFSSMKVMLCLLIRIASSPHEAILMSTHIIPYKYKKKNTRNYPKYSNGQLWDF